MYHYDVDPLHHQTPVYGNPVSSVAAAAAAGSMYGAGTSGYSSAAGLSSAQYPGNHCAQQIPVDAHKRDKDAIYRYAVSLLLRADVTIFN